MFVLLFSSVLLLTGAHCRTQLRTAKTTVPNGTHPSTTEDSRVVSCETPNATLVIRTAYYLTPTQRMTSEDVIKVYRHCENRLEWCDVTKAGVDREFELSYYCLEGPFLNPCSNTTSANSTSLLFNYSRHAGDCDVTCQCNIWPLTSEGHVTLHIRALNLFQESGREGDDGKDDVTDDVKVPDPEGCNSTTEEPGGPSVLFASPERQWEVERRATPVQWQLKGRESSSFSLTFHRMHAVTFGRLWVDLQGQRMEVSCGATVEPRLWRPLTSGSPPLHTSSPGKPVVSSTAYKPGHLVTYAAVAGAMVLLLTVVIIIIVAKCRRRRRRRRIQHVHPHSGSDASLSYGNGNGNWTMDVELKEVPVKSGWAEGR